MTSKPKPKRQKKTDRQKLDAECMEYLKQIVRLRDGGCVTPGPACGGCLTASHWQKRGKQATRYDLRNVNCQCSNCNGRHNNYTSYYDAFMLRRYGEAVCLGIADRASLNSFKWSITELEEIADRLKAEYERLSAFPPGTVGE
jgi:hypothetical protein